MGMTPTDFEVIRRVIKDLTTLLADDKEITYLKYKFPKDRISLEIRYE